MIKSKARLVEEFGKLPPISELYEKNNSEWTGRRIAIRKHVAEHDIDEFLRWSTINATMFTREAEWIDRSYDELMEDDTDRWMKAITEVSTGVPHRYSRNEKTSGNLINQAYHLMQLEKFTGKPVTYANRIVEFGGGYGAMCVIARRLGFKGAYHIYDLPEMILIQDYYLNQLGYSKELYLRDVDDHGRFPVPPIFVDYLIACYSLSETKGRLREVFIEATKARYVFLAFGGFWGEEDGSEPVEKLMSKLDKYDWELTNNKVQGVPHRYLFGERNVDD